MTTRRTDDTTRDGRRSRTDAAPETDTDTRHFVMRGAELLMGKTRAAALAGKPLDEIRRAALRARRVSTEGKTPNYVAARFALAVETEDKARVLEVTRLVLGDDFAEIFASSTSTAHRTRVAALQKDGDVANVADDYDRALARFEGRFAAKVEAVTRSALAKSGLADVGDTSPAAPHPQRADAAPGPRRLPDYLRPCSVSKDPQPSTAQRTDAGARRVPDWQQPCSVTRDYPDDAA